MLWKGIINSHQDVHKVILLVSFWDMLVYELPVPVIRLIEVSGREVCLDVSRDDVGVSGEVMRHLNHILNEPCYGSVSTKAYAIVECSVREFCFHERSDSYIEMILRNLHLHKGCYDLTRSWLVADEGIKKRVKRAVVDVIEKPHQVSLPMQLEMNAIYAPALVRPVSEISFYDGINFHINRP